MDIRTGLGYDIHRMDEKEGKDFRLAGIGLPGGKVIAHSDGDCLYHSLANAVLSALGKEDIGTYFPDNSSQTENMDSREILQYALSEMKNENFIFSNVVIIVVLEKIRLKPYKAILRKKLAEELGIEENRIAVHANTKEGMDAIGRAEAVAVLSQVCLIKM